MSFNKVALGIMVGGMALAASVAAQARTEVGHSSNLRALVAQHAAQNGVPFALADAVVRVESNYNPRAANRSGAMGLMQIKAQTARGQGFNGHASELLNPETNVRFAMRYLATAYRMSGGDICGTVMRYQQGHGARRMTSADVSYCNKARGYMAMASRG
jgi:soluble lytic murein transglycosylase-like protein